MILTDEQIQEYEVALKQMIPRWLDRDNFVPKGQLFRGVVIVNACYEVRDLLDTIHELKRKLALAEPVAESALASALKNIESSPEFEKKIGRIIYRRLRKAGLMDKQRRPS